MVASLGGGWAYSPFCSEKPLSMWLRVQSARVEQWRSAPKPHGPNPPSNACVSARRTGAVKITPAHDPNDFACGKRHNLEFIDCMTDDGFMADNCGEFKGMKRFDCRYLVMKKLDAMV